MKNLQKLVEPGKYQIFLFTCPAKIPINFARHPWFVCAKEGKVSRLEISFKKNGHNSSMGKHLHLDYLPPLSGTGMIPFISKKFLWEAKLLGYISGDETSAAKDIFYFIEKSGDVYPYRDRYLLWGPNSNTYVQWILNNFPEWNIKLPWNCFGKNYKNSRNSSQS